MTLVSSAPEGRRSFSGSSGIQATSWRVASLHHQVSIVQGNENSGKRSVNWIVQAMLLVLGGALIFPYVVMWTWICNQFFGLRGFFGERAFGIGGLVLLFLLTCGAAGVGGALTYRGATDLAAIAGLKLPGSVDAHLCAALGSGFGTMWLVPCGVYWWKRRQFRKLMELSRRAAARVVTLCADSGSRWAWSAVRNAALRTAFAT